MTDSFNQIVPETQDGIHPEDAEQIEVVKPTLLETQKAEYRKYLTVAGALYERLQGVRSQAEAKLTIIMEQENLIPIGTAVTKCAHADSRALVCGRVAEGMDEAGTVRVTYYLRVYRKDGTFSEKPPTRATPGLWKAGNGKIL